MSLQGLNIAKRSLLANQAVMDVINNNIANMNTEGYSKQRVDLATNASNRSASSVNDIIKMNNGVQIEQVVRVRDEFLDDYFRDENTSLGYYDELKNHTQIIETATNELGDSGLSSVMSEFFDAANQLASDPTDSVLRTQFVQRAVDITNKFHSMRGDLEEIRTDLVGDISQPGSLDTSQAAFAVTEVNNLLTELASVNQTIKSTTKADTPPALLDHRDMLLDNLSGYIPISYEELSTGEVNVFTKGVQLINSNNIINNFFISTGDTANPAMVSIVETEGGGDVVSDVKTIFGEEGSLKAILDLGGSDASKLSISSSIDKLDKLAQEFAQEINAIQLYQDPSVPEAALCMTYDVLGAEVLEVATSPIFLDQADETLLDENLITAANIQINSIVLNDPNKIATAIGETTDATCATVTPSAELQVGNTENALKFSNLRDKSIGDLNSLTIEEAIKDFSVDIGVKIDSINTNYDIKDSIVTQAEMTRQSTMGVNLDEELIDLVKYQRAYEASAQVFNTISEVFQILMGLAR